MSEQLPLPITISDMIAEVTLELEFRSRVFPRKMQDAGLALRNQLQRRLEVMQAVKARLEAERAPVHGGERMNAAAWDRWYQTLPEDVRRKLAVHDFRRLGDCFRTAFISAPSAIAPARARLILRLVQRFEDGDLGADTMAQAVSEEAQAIIDTYEPERDDAA